MSLNCTPPISPSQSVSLFSQLTEKSGEVPSYFSPYSPFLVTFQTFVKFYSTKLVAKLIGPIADLGFDELEVLRCIVSHVTQLLKEFLLGELQESP